MNDISIIPKPTETQILSGSFELGTIQGIITKTRSDEEKQIAKFFQEYFNKVGLHKVWPVFLIKAKVLCLELEKLAMILSGFLRDQPKEKNGYPWNKNLSLFL